MDEKHAEVLSAFFDGERVDADLLAESLAQPGSSELLAQFAAMRREVERDDCRPRPEFLEQTAEKMRRLKSRRLWARRLGRLSLAASLLLLAGLAGFELGSSGGNRRQGEVAQITAPPPVAMHVETATSQPATLPPAPLTTQTSTKPVAKTDTNPPPRESLRLRFGSWSRPAPPATPAEGGGAR
jgi:negative regulator of sigma E activity